MVGRTCLSVIGWTKISSGFDDPRHHGHYNRLYINNRDLTFSDVTESAGLISPPIKMLNPDGEPDGVGRPRYRRDGERV